MGIQLASTACILARIKCFFKSRVRVNPDQLVSGERELLWNNAMSAKQRELADHPKRYALILPEAIRSGERLSCVARLEARLENSLPAVYYCLG
jgi:hypothetical protein